MIIKSTIKFMIIESLVQNLDLVFRELRLRLLNIEKDKISFLSMKQDIYTLFLSRSSLKIYDGTMNGPTHLF